MAIINFHCSFLNHLNLLNFSKDKELSPVKNSTMIWASGTINSNYDVKYINHLKEKLTNLYLIFKTQIENECFNTHSFEF